MDKRGQIGGAAIAIVSAIVVIAVGIMVLAKVTTSMTFVRTYPTYATVNPTFTDNTDGWDNYIENGAVNSWNSGGYVTVSTTENDAVTDNGVWYQSLSVSDLYDGIDSATTTFKYRVIDNVGQSSIVVKALLSRPSDNVTLYDVTLTENSATWTSVENNVDNLITATGTYTLYLRAELLGTGESVNLVVGFDDASLKVKTYDKPIEEESAEKTSNMAFTALSILAISAIVMAALWIVSTVARRRG